MAWIALSGPNEHRFSLSGLGSDSGKSPTANVAVTPDSLLARGSLVLETKLSSASGPQELLSYRRSFPWVSGLSLQAIPGGSIACVSYHGGETAHSVLKYESAGQHDIMRITYSWDAPKKWGRLAVEWPGTDKVFVTQLANPKPIPLAAIQAMTTDPLQRVLDSHVLYFAFTTDIEPLGPVPTLTAHVPVATAYGYRPAGRIKPGDLVRTQDNSCLPVLAVVKRTVPARGLFRPMRLRTPYFGLQQDIVVSPEQRLVIEGSEVEYQYGREAVLLPVRHLSNGTSILSDGAAATVTYSQILLANHEPIRVAGILAESLYIGRLRRKADMLDASLLADYERAMLPEHAKPVFPVLKPFEAVTLAEHRAA